VIEETQIVTHSDPIGRGRTNFISRIDVDVPAQGRYEQIWTRTEDQETRLAQQETPDRNRRRHK
jgi:hypothetical protein